MKKFWLFWRVPIAYKKIIMNYYEGEEILHDCDHLPYSFPRVYEFEKQHNVKVIYAFRPKFVDYLVNHKIRPDPEQLCVHFDGDLENFEHFCSELKPKWINGHDQFNNRMEILSEHAKDYGLEITRPVVFSDYSWIGDLVQGFLKFKSSNGLFNFHLDYFWPLFDLV
jgi:hypothetical protein